MMGASKEKKKNKSFEKLRTAGWAKENKYDQHVQPSIYSRVFALLSLCRFALVSFENKNLDSSCSKDAHFV